WFARCCAREPQDRFPTAGQAIAALGLALGVAEDSQRMSLPSAAPSNPTVVRPPRDESSRTAFSATAPASPAVSAYTAPPVVPLRPPSSSTRLILLGAGMALVLGASGILMYASRRPQAPAAILPPESTAMSAAVPTATPVTIVTPSTVAPIEAAAPSASAVQDPKRSPPPVRVAPEPPTTARHVTVAPPKTASPAPPPPATALPAPPPPPSDPLGTRH
ncbi:MAG: hypothetical protein ACMG6S_11490, partial [Byssovorax sp.]